VYDKRFWVVIPALLLVTGYTGMVFRVTLTPLLKLTLLGPAVVGCFVDMYIEKARPGTDSDIFDVAKAWMTAYFCMTLSSNIICSGELLLNFHLMLSSMVTHHALFPMQQGRSLRGYSLPGPMKKRGRIGELQLSSSRAVYCTLWASWPRSYASLVTTMGSTLQLTLLSHLS
jgi:hypothetical protein